MWWSKMSPDIHYKMFPGLSITQGSELPGLEIKWPSYKGFVLTLKNNFFFKLGNSIVKQYCISDNQKLIWWWGLGRALVMNTGCCMLSDESLNSTPKTNITPNVLYGIYIFTLYIWTLNKNLKIRGGGENYKTKSHHKIHHACPEKSPFFLNKCSPHSKIHIKNTAVMME